MAVCDRPLLGGVEHSGETRHAAGESERFAIDLGGKTTTKRVHTARPPVSVIVDPDEWLLGTVACVAPGAGVSECNTGFRCAKQAGQAGQDAGAASVCVPR